MLKLNENWKFQECFPTVSVYWTALNCLRWKYPLEDSIKSFAWADELIVVDGGSTDGTVEMLEKLKEKFEHLQVYSMPIDETDPGKDGAQKAIARAMTTCEFTIQVDADEICGGHPNLWKKKIKEMPAQIDILNLFVYEPVGDICKLRMNESHNPWKWRIFRNKPEISHGIPKQDKLEIDGKIYSKGGSDGCFPINILTEELYPSYSETKLQNLILVKNSKDKEKYASVAKDLMSSEPFVIHVGHVDLDAKIRNYLSNWHTWWCHLYNKDETDPQNNQHFPGVKLSDVTKEMIQDKIVSIIKDSHTTFVEFPFLLSLSIGATK